MAGSQVAMIMRAVTAALVAMLLPWHCSLSPQPVLPIVPKPQATNFGRGQFHLPAAGVNIKLSVATLAEHQTLRRSLDAALAQLLGGPGHWDAAGAPPIWLGIPAENEPFRRHATNLGLWPVDNVGDEGYVLDVSAAQVTIAANPPPACSMAFSRSSSCSGAPRSWASCRWSR